MATDGQKRRPGGAVMPNQNSQREQGTTFQGDFGALEKKVYHAVRKSCETPRIGSREKAGGTLGNGLNSLDWT
jgi:hypothetical protein